MKGDNTQQLTKRKCRWCGGAYVYPKGHSRAAAGCPECQPSLFAVDAKTT